jgi:hypothetical protein
MITVVRRTFLSCPQRDALSTWNAVVDLLASSGNEPARALLLAVAGIASSLIADQAPKAAPIIVTADGPRTRIYCVYDDDAIEGSDADESPLGFNALNGDWHVSLPCLKDDLEWIEAALKTYGSRITARDVDSVDIQPNGKGSPNATEPLVLDPKGFLGR